MGLSIFYLCWSADCEWKRNVIVQLIDLLPLCRPVEATPSSVNTNLFLKLLGRHLSATAYFPTAIFSLSSSLNNLTMDGAPTHWAISHESLTC